MQVWVLGVNQSRAELLMSGKTSDRGFRIRNSSWRHVHHHLWGKGGGGVTSSTAFVALSDNFVYPFMETYFIFGVPNILNFI